MVIYTCDPATKDLLSYHVEEDGYQLLPNETTLPLPDGIKHPKLVDGKWVGDPLAVNLNQSLIMQLSQQGAKQEAQIKQLQQVFMVTNQQQSIAKSKEEVQ